MQPKDCSGIKYELILHFDSQKRRKVIKVEQYLKNKNFYSIALPSIHLYPIFFLLLVLKKSIKLKIRILKLFLIKKFSISKGFFRFK